MQITDLVVEVRDKQLARRGLIRPEDMSLAVEDVFNGVGQWKVVLPIEHPLVDELRTPGAGIIITGPTDVLLSGPCIKNEFASTPEDPGGSIAFEGISDSHLLADHVALPDPSNTNPTTQTLSHDVRTGPPETLMHAYVNANIGPSAPADRRVTHLTMGPNGARGTATKKSARFPVLGELLGELAGPPKLGFRIVQRDDVLRFETFEVADRTAYIRLGIENSTLSGSRVAITAPTATRVIVAGQGEMVDRTFRMVTTEQSLAAESEWGRRIERYKDQRQTDDDDELDDAGLEVLEDEGFTAVAAQVVPIDDTDQEMGRDWGLGDRVTVIVNDQELTSIVTGLIVKADSDGLRYGAVLGDPTGFSRQAAVDKKAADLAARLGALERNETAAPAMDALRVMGVW